MRDRTGAGSFLEPEFVDVVGYNETRIPDEQYKELLDRILTKGKKIGTQLEDSALTIMGHQLRYDLRNGFPLMTERDLSKTAQPAFAELSAFLNGARTLEELEKFGCGFWKSFITKEKTDKRGLAEGDLGDGSYGVAYHDFPTGETGVTFNQVKAVISQIKEKPHLRTHVATTIVPHTNFRAEGYEQKTVWVPCHGSMLHFRVIEDELYLHHTQRSADTPIGLVSNIAQYAGLLLIVAKETGYRPAEYIHTLSDAHIYERQIENVEELISRDSRPFPKALVSLALEDTFSWRKGDIKIEEYDPHPPMKIDTPNN